MPDGFVGIISGACTDSNGVSCHQWREVDGKSVAVPENELRELEAKHGASNWYDWACRFWGTKWDADIFSWERTDKNTITVYFNTAWAPPIALYEHLEENGWMVSALYHEPGMVFVGRFVEGEDQYFEYDLNDEDSLLEIPEELIEWANLREALDEFQQDQEN
jgi:hypothetical protein